MMRQVDIILIGDSDIARWPEALFPSVVTDNIITKINTVSGHSGATLEDIIPYVQDIVNNNNEPIKKSVKRGTTSKNNNNNVEFSTTTIWIICAGENDLANSKPISESVNALRTIIDIVIDKNITTTNTNKIKTNNHNIIFLGPKFEPWLETDIESRKEYVQLSLSLQRCCNKQYEEHNVSFIECLTMFCIDSTKNIPGALLGGKAIPNKQYFDYDLLHLSLDGYMIWKHIIETKILQIYSSNTV